MCLPIVFAATMGLVFAITALASAADVEGLPEAEAPKRLMAQQCLNDLQAIEEQLRRVGFGVLPPEEYRASTPSGYSGFYVFGAGPRRARRCKPFVTPRTAMYSKGMSGRVNASMPRRGRSTNDTRS